VSFDEVRQSAESLITAWGGLPIAYDNVPFDSSAYDSWVRITVQDGDSFLMKTRDLIRILHPDLLPTLYRHVAAEQRYLAAQNRAFAEVPPLR